jgi:outer membrane protein OmpA-like peptidoglycan-associated protein
MIATLIATPEPARAKEPWLLDLEASGGAPVTDPQRDWYGAGGSLAIGVGRPLASWLTLEARLRTALFLDGEQPSTAGVRDHGNATLNGASLGMLLRIPDESPRRATGAWLSAAMGGAFTGKELRATWEAGLGYGFGVTQTVALGPLLRFIQIIQPDDQLSPRDARLLLGGIRLSLLDATPAKPAPTRSDRDGDGIEDERDGCPDAPEDRDGYADDDGCPDADNDSDGLLDASDGCPDAAEDKDGFEDEDGCPDADNDKDGIADKDDQCPLEPETVNGERDDDGCPDEGLIVMRDDRVVLEERVLFDLNSPRVKHSGAPILRAIVKLRAQHPEWVKMRIEGHTDARGDAAFNQQLSERRAHNVREALIALDMDPESLVAEGFGASRLLTTDNTEEAHSKNRRVEFVVISRAATAPSAPPPASSGPSGGEVQGAAEPPSASPPPPQPTEAADRAGGKEQSW